MLIIGTEVVAKGNTPKEIKVIERVWKKNTTAQEQPKIKPNRFFCRKEMTKTYPANANSNRTDRNMKRSPISAAIFNKSENM